jgi:hypothetical protein
VADVSLGQAAYEAYWEAFGPEPAQGWSRISAHLRAAWEAAATAAVEACGGSGCQSPHGPDGRCFDCATDDEMAAAIPPPPGGSRG